MCVFLHESRIESDRTPDAVGEEGTVSEREKTESACPTESFNRCGIVEEVTKAEPTTSA